MKHFLLWAITITICLSCSKTDSDQQDKQDKTDRETAKANAIYQAYFDEMVSLNPNFQTRLGIKKDYDKWTDISDEHTLKIIELQKQYFQKLQDSVDHNFLDDYAKLAYDNFVILNDRLDEKKKYRLYNYPVNQMFGRHTTVVTILTNAHRIDSLQDAKDYISRVKAVAPLFDQLVENLKLREDKGIVLPKHLFDKVTETCKNLTKAISDDGAKSHMLYQDFGEKIDTLQIEEDTKEELLSNLEDALQTNFKPAYEELLSFLSDQKSRAKVDEGVWKFPEGNKFYKYRLELMNTMQISPEEIYELGLNEVNRIHNEIKQIMAEVAFDGSLQDFLNHMRDADQFFLETTPNNKEVVLDTVNALVDGMWGKIDDYFITQPKADLIVKPVEPYREKSAGYAFYQRPSADGSRPGIYYINLFSLKSVPLYELEALTYHEAIPGHHFNLTIAQELKSIPEFMKHQNNTAHTEGWGLYCERLGKEMGFYQNPYSDFGRLNMELFRAVRLVVDAGIHHKKWDRAKAVEYYINNTASSVRRCESMVDRHMVMPGQATAYKVGMNKILELRAKAKKALGGQYDIKDFHDVILTNGLLPLEIVEQLVDEYIESKKAA